MKADKAKINRLEEMIRYRDGKIYDLRAMIKDLQAELEEYREFKSVLQRLKVLFDDRRY
jgi:predicted nuclease with TOPRIM domain